MLSGFELYSRWVPLRFSMAMFSWQPLPRILICRFIYSARLRSRLKGKKYSHIVLRNRSPITEERVIMFPDGERSNHKFPNFLTHGGSARNVINQNYLTVRHFSANGIELPLGEAEMKILRDPPYAALPLAPVYRSLAARFARHTWRAC